MFNFNISISNPFSKRNFRSLYCKSGSITKNKSWEVQLMQYSERFFELSISWYVRTDHAGPRINLGIFGYELDVSIYDHRHWDVKTNTWENYEDNNSK